MPHGGKTLKQLTFMKRHFIRQEGLHKMLY